MRRRIGSMFAGIGVALVPLAAAAQSTTGSRATDPPGDLGETLLYTFLALVGLFVIATLGYLYREKRGLNWAFQEPDAPHDEHGDHH